jgi:hypothetical protein
MFLRLLKLKIVAIKSMAAAAVSEGMEVIQP